MLDSKRDWRRIIRAAKSLKVASRWVTATSENHRGCVTLRWRLWPDLGYKGLQVWVDLNQGVYTINGDSSRSFACLREAEEAADATLTEDGWILADSVEI